MLEYNSYLPLPPSHPVRFFHRIIVHYREIGEIDKLCILLKLMRAFLRIFRMAKIGRAW